jgi:hypothetical protein
MNTARLIIMRWLKPSLLILLISLVILINPNLKDSKSQITGKWTGAYGVQYPYIDDYDELASRGINLILSNISSEPAEWEKHYLAIVKHDFKFIPVLWGTNQTAWSWNHSANEWELDIEKYPHSLGAQFLQFLRDHPDYLEHTYAIYGFHEPFNLENPETLSPDKIRKFWQQIHGEEFPDQQVKIYGESISWNSGCANGCVDFDAIGLYNFARCGLFRLGKYRIIEAVSGKDGLLIRLGACTNNRKSLFKAGGDLIEAIYDFSQQSAPAPDGSRTQFFALIQTFSQENPGLIYRMPDVEEMYEWGTQIVYPRRNHLAGMQWYVFRFDGLYDLTLGDNRYDVAGADRWEMIDEVADVLSGLD